MKIYPTISGQGDVFGLSNLLWGDLPLDMIFGRRDRNFGWGVFDDFSNFSLVTPISSGVAYYQSEGNFYRTYEESNTSTSTQAVEDGGSTYAVPNGFPVYTPQGGNSPQTTVAGSTNNLFAYPAVIQTPGQITTVMTAANADRFQMAMAPLTTATGASTSYCSSPFTPYLPAATGSSAYLPSKLYFECRLNFSTTNTTLSNFFVGLGSGNAYAIGTLNSPLASNTAYSTVPDLLGFGFLHGYTEGDISIVFNKAGGTIQDEKTASASALNLINMETYTVNGNNVIGSSSNKTAAVYFKLGFTVDFTAKGGNGTFTPYVNGVPFDGLSATSKLITNIATNPTILGTALGTTTWPAHPMTPCVGLYQQSTGTALNLTMDWWGFAQTFG